MKILAVDDDPPILEVLGALLAAQGIGECRLATSADAALEEIATATVPFDCFLLDIQMPGKSGIELCGEIRALPGYAQTPILMVTAVSQKSRLDDAFAMGATDYVAKPFDALDLTARLRVVQELVAAHAQTGPPAAGTARSALSEPVEFKGVPRCLGYVAFENYVRQLTRASRLHSAAIAIKIANIGALHKNLDRAGFLRMLESVARLLGEKLDAADAFLSYRGDGIFVCLIQHGTLIERDEAQSGLSGELASARFCDRDGVAHRLELAVGRPVTPAAAARSGSLGFLRLAIEDARQQARRISDTPLTATPADKAELLARVRQYRSLLKRDLVNGMLPIGRAAAGGR